MKCTFCQEDCDGKLILRDTQIQRADGKDMIVCSTCLNLYAYHEYDKLTKRLEQAQKTTTTS